MKNSQRLCQQRAVTKYNKANYDRLTVYVPKGQAEELKEAAQAAGRATAEADGRTEPTYKETSVNGFICRLIDNALEDYRLQRAIIEMSAQADAAIMEAESEAEQQEE